MDFISILKTYFSPEFHSVVEDYVSYINTNALCNSTSRADEQYEVHHILPRSLFPDYEFEPLNLVKLKLYDHFVAHYLIAKTKNPKMVYAFNMMNRVKTGFTDNQLEQAGLMYADFREELSRIISAANTGRTRTEEHKVIVGNCARGMIAVKDNATGITKRIPVSEYHANPELYTHHATGRVHKESTKQLMSDNGIKGKTAFTHRVTLDVIYEDESFIHPDYTKGNLVQSSVASERFKGDSHWTHTVTGESLRAKECPGPGWIKKRSNFENPFATQITVFDIRTGEKSFIQKTDRELHHVVHNAVIVHNDKIIAISPTEKKKLIKSGDFTKTSRKDFKYKGQCIK